MNWLFYSGGWVVVLGVLTVFLALRFAAQGAWTGAAAFTVAAILQYVYRAEIRRFVDVVSGGLSAGLAPLF